MRKVVVNTTPLIALSEIGKLDILKKLYGEIFIPDAVLNEVKTEPAFSEVRNFADWIHVEGVQDRSQEKIFRSRLHAGEVEVMLLALQSDADLVILDDMLARKTAKYMGLTVSGTLGVLLKAKERGIITKVEPVMEELIQNGLYVSKDIQRSVLKLANENIH